VTPSVSAPPPPQAPLLSVEELVVDYGAIRALKGVSLQVGQGELVAVIGSNGAGKTTLLRTLSGLQQATSGRASFAGDSLLGRSAHKVVAAGVAHVPEGRRVFAQQSVKDNLLLGAYLRLRKGDKAGVQEDLERMFDTFPRLRERQTQQAGTLSGGEQQMLAIGRILRTGARLLLLDEPTEGLAPVIIQQIGRTIRTLKEQGFTILLVEQNFRFASTVADRYYVMEHGRVVESFANAELDANLEKLHEYLGV
jgi:branched-chain amino acid transport system ATP-binding protein